MKPAFLRRSAVRLAREIGLVNVTRQALCESIGAPTTIFQDVVDMDFTAFMQSIRDEYGLIPAPADQPLRNRANPDLMREHIIASACDLALRPGGNYRTLRRNDLAEAVGLSVGMINHYWGSLEDIRDAVMKRAIQKDIPRLVAQGLAAGDPIAMTASKALKNRAAKSLIK